MKRLIIPVAMMAGFAALYKFWSALLDYLDIGVAEGSLTWACRRS
jgi:hypothetical protein